MDLSLSHFNSLPVFLSLSFLPLCLSCSLIISILFRLPFHYPEYFPYYLDLSLSFSIPSLSISLSLSFSLTFYLSFHIFPPFGYYTVGFCLCISISPHHVSLSLALSFPFFSYLAHLLVIFLAQTISLRLEREGDGIHSNDRMGRMRPPTIFKARVGPDIRCVAYPASSHGISSYKIAPKNRVILFRSGQYVPSGPTLFKANR